MAMHLASMVHGSGREREAHDHHRHLQHSNFYVPPPQARPYEASVAVAANPYTHPQASYYQPQAQAQAQAQPQPQQQPQQHRHIQSPPSPPVEEQKPSLPSISSLLGIADGDKATTDTAAQSPKSQQASSPQAKSEQLQPQQQRHSVATVYQTEGRPEQVAHAFGSAIVSNPRMALPPTPPMQPDSMVDGNQSPSATSSHSSVSAAPYYLGSSLNNMEPHHQRQHLAHASLVKRHSVPSQPSMSPYNASAYAQSPYASSPGGASSASFYSPETHGFGMYGQRPLPSNYAPQTIPMPVPTNSPNGSNPWQHHHYISASSQAAFPQSQDRYICSTCNKAFSRPSSLRIHSHSHTGEKPYKCPQAGCGKAFSVRSNMKRHERGCHAASGAGMPT